MPGPLNGIKVLSFGRMLSGPFASMLLSDLGAEVIKVEVPETGDLARYGGPFIEKISSYFLSINRGKKSITLDLKKKAAKEIIFKLSEQVDILLENFRPGVMDKLGFSYETIGSAGGRLYLVCRCHCNLRDRKSGRSHRSHAQRLAIDNACTVRYYDAGYQGRRKIQRPENHDG
jgi:crotonobetainyl-CoA:carnitine CoA-transferase CaiB-like acyl-CoA transferase